MKVTLFFALIFGLSACNTIRGIGEDLQAGGEAVTGVASSAQNDINSRAAPPQPVYRPAPAPHAYPQPTPVKPASPYYY